MADIADDGLKLQVADLSCAGKLLEDTKRLSMGGQKVEHLHLTRGPEANNCITFTSVMADTSPVAAPTRPMFKTDGPLFSQNDGQTVVKAFIGVGSNLAPGRPLAFDTDGRILDFSSPVNANVSKIENPSPPSNLKFDKFSGSLVLGVNVRF